MRKSFIILILAFLTFFLLASAWSGTEPLVYVHSVTMIRQPVHQKIPVGVSLRTAQGIPIMQAKVMFGTIPLQEIFTGQYGQYRADIDFNRFSGPMNFAITIKKLPSSEPNTSLQLPIIIRANLASRPNLVRITAPAEGQVFHRGLMKKIQVQWQLTLPSPITLWWADNDVGNIHALLGSVSLPAGTTSHMIDLTAIPIGCKHLLIEAQGPITHFQLDGPVTPDSIVAINSQGYVIVAIGN